MSGLRRQIALSDNGFARFLRSAYRSIVNFSLPAPAFLVRPILLVFLALREVYYFVLRVFICEPLFKAYCTKYGKRVRTGTFIHWITGSGRLIVGDDVLVDGKVSIMFAVRYFENPTLTIGNHSILSHGCSLTIGRSITIGEHCLIASSVRIFDAPGHPTDPELRRLGNPANPEDVRPVVIEDNAWIGMDAVIFPGVTIGKGSVVAVRSVVTRDVAPYTIVAGNPAREIARLRDPDNPAPAAALDVAPEVRSNPQEAAASPLASAPLSVPAAVTTPAEDSLSAVNTVVSQFLGIDQLDPDQDFYDAGVTSIMTLPLLIELEDRFQVSIPQDQFLDARTIRTLTSLIESLR